MTFDRVERNVVTMLVVRQVAAEFNRLTRDERKSLGDLSTRLHRALEVLALQDQTIKRDQEKELAGREKTNRKQDRYMRIKRD